MSSKRESPVKAGIGYTIGNYLIKGLSFLTIPIFSRLLSTSDFGIYNTFTAYEGMMFVLLGLAIHSSYKNARYKYKLVEEGAKPGRDYNTYISATMVLLLTSLLCWVLIANIFSGAFQKFLSINRLEQNLLIVYSFSTAVITCYNSYVGIEYKYKKFLTISACNAIFNIILSITLILTVFNDKRYLGRILGTAIPTVIISLYIILTFFKQAKPRNIVPFLKWGIKYSLPIVPHGISQIILSSFDVIMITKMVNASVSGIYSFAYTVFSIIRVTTTSLDSVWTPWFYEKKHKGDDRSIRKIGSLFAILMLAYSVALMLISPELIRILGPKEYWDASKCVFPLITGGYFAFLYNLPSCVEYYYEKTQFIMLGTIGAAVTNIVLNYFFITKFGYVAAAYTTLVTYFLYFLFHYFLARKIEGKYIYSNLVIALVCVGIVLSNILSLVLIDLPIIRWLLSIAIAAVTIVIEERNYGLAKRYFQSRRKGLK